MLHHNQKHHIKYPMYPHTHCPTLCSISHAYHIIQSALMFLLLVSLFCCCYCCFQLLLVSMLFLLIKIKVFFSLLLIVVVILVMVINHRFRVMQSIHITYIHVFWFIKLTTTNNINAISMPLIQLKQMLRITHSLTPMFIVYKHLHERIYA